MAKKKILPLGTKAYGISKTWVDKGAQAAGARIIPCKLITYENQGGKVLPIYQSVFKGNAQFTEDYYYIYSTLDEAMENLKSKLKKKKK